MKEKHKTTRREKLKKAMPTVMGYIERREKAAQNQLPKHLRPLPGYPVFVQIALNAGIIFTLPWLMLNREGLDVLDLVDQPAGAARARVAEMAGHALPDRLGLAHVEHPPALAAEEVHARGVGQRATLRADALLA